MRQVNGRAIERVRQVGAARASFLPSRAEHEVIDNQLASSVEQVGQRLPPMCAFENIFFPDLFPRHLAPLPAQFVAQARKLFLLCQQVFSRRQPFRRRDHIRCKFFRRRCRHHHSFSLDSFFFVLRRIRTASAVRPPVETALPTTTPALAMHTGHISILLTSSLPLAL
jgi:hypothetical protein